ncbi:HAD family hydrolase [Streptomyces griseocarneus]|nr:HAD family hydrolase [Streptomyces griseocarneus]
MHPLREQATKRLLSRPSQQRLLLLDLDNTIVDRGAGLLRWAEEFAREYGLGADAVEWLIRADEDGLKPRDHYFAEVRHRFALLATPGDLHHAYQARYPRHMHCPQPVLDQLARLRDRGWTIGVITNGLTATQEAVLEHTGVIAYLDGWSISEAEGVRKPDTAHFERAASRCGRSLNDGGWAIGDSIDADIRGGQNAGLSTIWISRQRTWPISLPPPDHAVGDIAEALQFMLGHTES